ncbi:Riean_0653 family protein [Larkinella harenae]
MKRAVLVFFLAFTSACFKEENPVLPMFTQTGQNTFGCMIKDQVWVPRESMNIFALQARPGASYHPRAGRLYISASQTSQDNKRSGFLLNFYRDSTGVLLPEFQTSWGERNTFYFDDSGAYYAEPNFSEITISKLDTLRNIVSGTFSVSLRNTKTNQSLKATNGVFDFKFKKIE